MLEKVLGAIVRVAGVLAFVVLLVALSMSVISRYFNLFPGTMHWVEEGSRFLFIWLTFLGAVVAFERREHIRIDILARTLPARARRVYETGVDLAILSFLLVVTRYGIELALDASYPSSALNVPFTYVYLSVPACAAMMSLQVIAGAIRRWRMPAGETRP